MRGRAGVDASHRSATPRRAARRTVGAAAVTLMLLSGCAKEQPAIVYDEPTTITTPPAQSTSTTAAAGQEEQLAPWVDVTANLAGLPSQCGNLGLVAARPGTDQLIAGVALQGLWVSDGNGGPWLPFGSGSPEKVRNRPVSLIFDPSDPEQFWESGSWTGPSVVRTSDGGRTFTTLGDLYNVEGLSIDLADPARRTMLVGSQQRSDLYRSTNGGATWAEVAPELLPWVFAAYPLVLTDRIHLLGTTAGGGKEGAGIWRTVDGGESWEQVAAAGVGGPALVATNGTIYWPIQDGGGLLRSTDGGQTFSKLATGGVLNSFNLVELPDGRLAAVGRSYVVVSSDEGVTWRALGPPLPVTDAFGLTYSASRDAIYVWRRDCSEEVPAGGIQRLDLAPLGPSTPAG